MMSFYFFIFCCWFDRIASTKIKSNDLISLSFFQCRYTLQYTYPYAYYMEKGARKQLVGQIFLSPFTLKYFRAFVQN